MIWAMTVSRLSVALIPNRAQRYLFSVKRTIPKNGGLGNLAIGVFNTYCEVFGEYIMPQGIYAETEVLMMKKLKPICRNTYMRNSRIG